MWQVFPNNGRFICFKFFRFISLFEYKSFKTLRPLNTHKKKKEKKMVTIPGYENGMN